ncbi:MAG: CHAT domain-containing protein, partial [Gammaproteobacteria bacterium]|nr:CHAT domain-containing protein [Gammaproteobacteria bacterium]
NGLQRSQRRDRFVLRQQWAARPMDVRRAMLDFKPNIVHFCGHGEGEAGIAFENESGQTGLVGAEALAGLFKLFAPHVECVLLNACYSEVQAEAIARHIGCVIGMGQAIGDQAALEFSVAFYDALGAGESLNFAYELGCNAIQMAGIPEHLTPVLKSRTQPRPVSDQTPAETVTPLVEQMPGCRCDIAVSFASLDNRIPAGAESGWVSTLIDNLKIMVDQQLGADKAFLWLDEVSPGDETLSPEAGAQLENTAALLMILSPAYLATARYRQILEKFSAKAGSGCIFLAEYQAVEPRPELANISVCRFWTPDAAGRARTLGVPKPQPYEYAYYQKLEDLGADMAAALKHHPAAQSEFASAHLPASEAERTVFLAEVTDDLSLRRDELKRNLETQGIKILPEQLYFFPTEAELRENMAADLKKSMLFVQLLSECVPQRPPGAGLSTPQIQYECAQELEIPIAQWRDRPLAVNDIANPAQRALLSVDTVIACSMLEFQQHVLQTLKKLEAEKNVPQPEMEPAGSELVFINAVPKELFLARQIEEILSAYGLACILPMGTVPGISPHEIREDLKNNLLCCDAVIVSYAFPASLAWVRKQLLQCHRILGKREQPLKVIALYDKPAANKPAVNMRLPNLHILHCPQPTDDGCLLLFMKALHP